MLSISTAHDGPQRGAPVALVDVVQDGGHVVGPDAFACLQIHRAINVHQHLTNCSQSLEIAVVNSLL